MKLIVGLGNIGEKFKHTRHNIGFDVIEILKNQLNINDVKNKFDGLYFKYENGIFFMPTTFMNLSGIAVKKIVDFYKLNYDDILIIMDDMSLPVGKIKLKSHGTSGGHKGLQNIIDNLNSIFLKRVKIGIGRPLKKEEINNFVLSEPVGDEKIKINNSLKIVANLILDYLKHDFNFILNSLSKSLDEH